MRWPAAPAGCGAEQVIDEPGRANEVVYTAHFRVTYWADHAVRFSGGTVV